MIGWLLPCEAGEGDHAQHGGGGDRIKAAGQELRAYFSISQAPRIVQAAAPSTAFGGPPPPRTAFAGEEPSGLWISLRVGVGQDGIGRVACGCGAGDAHDRGAENTD